MLANVRNPAETILFDAVEIPDPKLRAAYLDNACGDDQALRSEIEQLIANHFRAGRFLEPPEANPLAEIEAAVVERAGASIGPYRLLEEIGEGGMGVVFMAEQTAPVRRRVALKIIKPGMDTRQVVVRFEAERQALTLMEHPNIARALDAGATDSGRPYFVMELVRGIPLTDYCDREQLQIDERLRLFVQVCRAVQHAHQKGVIHRDLKPSNILVTVVDGAAVPKVIDFGVAKATGAALTERTLFTGFHQFIGTPLYMSPEQADLSGVDVDTRSDVYSLGVLLYELLTGTTPLDQQRFREAPLEEIRRIVREDEPPRPSVRLSTLGNELQSTTSAKRQANLAQLRLAMRGELDWIVMKALEKDRQRRYETVSALAEDVQRHLNDEQVEACPPTRRYRLGKFARRHRIALITGACVLVSLAGGLAAAVSQAYRAIRAERLALAAELVESGNSSLHLGIEAVAAGNFDLARSYLEDAVKFHRKAIEAHPLEGYRDRLRGSYTNLMFVLAHLGDHVAAANVVENFLAAKLRGFPGRAKDGLVHSAILIMVRCAGLAARDDQLPPHERVAIKLKYLTRARELFDTAKPGAMDASAICIIADLISVDDIPGGLAPDFALELAERAKRESNGASYAKQSLAWAKYRIRGYQECIDLIGVENGHSTSGGFLAMALWMTGDRERALATYESAAAFARAYSTEPIHPQRWMLEQVQVEAAKLLGLKSPGLPTPIFRSY